MTSTARGEGSGGRRSPVVLPAAAKLTTSLRIVGVRADGYHLLDAEMVTLDLADALEVTDADEIRVVVDVEAVGQVTRPVPLGGDNLVVRALEAVGRRARVRLVKRIPAGAGLGGGSADAAAILRWAGCRDPDMAVRLGADVPFCVVGGRAMVGGIGEMVTPLPHEERQFVLLLAPFGVDTSAVYRAWDELAVPGLAAAPETSPSGVNDLESAALRVEPRLRAFKRAFEEATGRSARLAGSGSTWFVEGSFESLGIDQPQLRVGEATGVMVAVRTVPRIP